MSTTRNHLIHLLRKVIHASHITAAMCLSLSAMSSASQLRIPCTLDEISPDYTAAMRNTCRALKAVKRTPSTPLAKAA